MSANVDAESVAAVPAGVGDAVGVDSRKWYVAIVKNNTEKTVQQRLAKLNYETFVAIQPEWRVWKNGKRALIDKVVIPSMVFVRCTEAERKHIVSFSFINRFLTNRAAVSVEGRMNPVAIIPQKQIDMLRFMLGQSDIPITFSEAPLRQHDKVIVVRGDLKGVEGEVIQTCGCKSDVVVRIELLGSAKMTIDSVNLRLLK